MEGLRGTILLLAGTALWGLTACAGPSLEERWRSLPQPDPRNPADFVAWAQDCAQEGVGENAWDIYKQLIETMPSPGAKERLRIGYATRWPWEEERFAAAAEWMERSGQTFDLLRRASQSRGLYVPFQRDGPYLLNVTAESRNPIRMAARGLAAAGWREFYRGHPEQLQGDAVVLLRVAHQLTRAPTPTGRLGKGAFARALCRDVMLQLLDRSDDPGRLAVALGGALQRADPPVRGLVRMVMMHYAVLADMYQRIYRWDEEAGRYVMDRAEIDPLRGKFRRLREISEEDLTEHLLPSDYAASVAFIKAYHRKLAELVELPYAEGREPLRELEEAVADQGTYLTRGTVKKLSLFLSERQQTAATRRAAHLIYAIWAHRQERGAFPGSLNELTVPGLGELRRDPFAPGDFVYRLTSEGFTLYTVGLDGSDQGGEHREDWGREEAGDYVFWPVQPITPPWLRPRILITSEGRIFEQPRDGGQLRELSPEEIGLTGAQEDAAAENGAGQSDAAEEDRDPGR